MLVPILATLAAIIVLLIIFIATRPAEFQVTRSTTITAVPGTVFPLVNNLRRWEAWSPWARIDPQMKLTYEGPEAGAGSKYHWVGNKKVGEGRMTLTQSVPDERVEIRLEFIKPFATTNTTVFEFKPQGDQTLVTWNMRGRKSFMFKAFSLFLNMDKLVGSDFEKGLAAMKAIAEAK